MSALVQVTADEWVLAYTVLSVRVEAINSQRGCAVMVGTMVDGRARDILCGEYAQVDAAREAASVLVQAVNDALRVQA